MKNLSLKFNSYLDEVEDINPSFAKGKLKICYHGLNRNNSNISKNSIIEALPSLYNVPIVTHYIKDTEDIQGKEGDFGGHDSHYEKVNGKYKKVYDTTPVGLVPESSEFSWETVEDESGIHEYLVADVLLWKRQREYDKMKTMETIQHSMEIDVDKGEFMDSGAYDITKFHWTALTLLGTTVEPCFEGSELELQFNKQDFRAQLSEMVEEYKKEFNYIEGGNKVENENENVIENETPTVEEEVVEETTATEPIVESTEPTQEGEAIEVDPIVETATEPITEVESGTEFSLSANQLNEAIYRQFSEITYECNYYGEVYKCRKFWLADVKDGVIVAYDDEVGNYYGFSYTESGDTIAIDFENGVEYISDWRPKVNGKTINNFTKELAESKSNIYSKEIEKINEKLEVTQGKFAVIEDENNKLKEFKLEIEKAEKKAKVKGIVEKFSLLSEDEISPVMEKAINGEINLEDLEDKLFALVGKKTITNNNFSLNNEPTGVKMVVTPIEEKTTPYGSATKYFTV